MTDLNTNIEGANPSFMTEKLLTPAEVARRFDVSVDWVQAHASGRKLPKLPCRRLGKLIRFLESDIQMFLEQQASTEPAAKLQRFKII